ncbi:MAG: 3-keto-5-aminohexanoate cleavage protein [Chloroflexi bacterium]|nr:3-keto-5-aminohexanoate cleavage protein [Chloroflexota bacterium]
MVAHARQMKKLIISAALVGGVTPTQAPYNPITPDEIAKEAKRAEDAGAAIVHIHPRDPRTGEPTTDTQVFAETLSKIHHTTNLVMCPTTGLAHHATVEQRTAIVSLVRPEVATHDIGCNWGSRDRIVKRTTKWKYDWEKPYLEAYKKVAKPFTQGDIEWMCEEMQKADTKPEYELFNTGFLCTMAYLKKEFNGYCAPPLWATFIFGTFSGCPASPEQIVHMKRTADDMLGKDTYEWQVIGVGYPAQFEAATMAIIMGGHCRVGLEDNLYIERGVYAKSSAQAVERMVRIARELGREIATPDEAREILKLKGKSKVNL